MFSQFFTVSKGMAAEQPLSHLSRGGLVTIVNHPEKTRLLPSLFWPGAGDTPMYTEVHSLFLKQIGHAEGC